jgi:hypothetical protein
MLLVGFLLLVLVTDILKQPFSRNCISKPPSFGQFISRPADSRKLQSLCSRVSQKGYLIIAGARMPAPCHEIRNRFHLGIIGFADRRYWYRDEFPSLRCPGEIGKNSIGTRDDFCRLNVLICLRERADRDRPRLFVH